MSISNPECNNTHGTSSTEQNIDEVVSDFIDSTKNLAADLDATESVLSNFISSAEALGELVTNCAHDSAQAVSEANKNSDEIQSNSDEIQSNSDEIQSNSDEIQSNSDEIDEERDKRSAEIEGVHNRISNLEQDIDDVNPTPQADKTTLQADDLTPIEQLSQAEEIEEVTESKSVQRAVSLFRNIDNWGSRTPKGIVLKPSDNPLSLLEADRDESLCWKQFYRAAEALEKLSQGSATFFSSDKHGKIICLHQQSEAYQRVVEGTLTPSSVEAEG